MCCALHTVVRSHRTDLSCLIANAKEFLMQHTQVDDGQYSESDEEGGYGKYSSTQVDDDYLQQLAASDELLQEALNEEPDDADNDSSVVHLEPIVEEVVDVKVTRENDSSHWSESGDELPQGDNQEIDESETETDTADMLDFCIADTQLPVPAAVSNGIATTTGDPVMVGQSDDPVEDSHISVYDYVSPSAPASTGEAARTIAGPQSKAHPYSPPWTRPLPRELCQVPRRPWAVRHTPPPAPDPSRWVPCCCLVWWQRCQKSPRSWTGPVCWAVGAAPRRERRAARAAAAAMVAALE